MGGKEKGGDSPVWSEIAALPSEEDVLKIRQCFAKGFFMNGGVYNSVDAIQPSRLLFMLATVIAIVVVVIETGLLVRGRDSRNSSN